MASGFWRTLKWRRSTPLVAQHSVRHNYSLSTGHFLDRQLTFTLTHSSDLMHLQGPSMKDREETHHEVTALASIQQRSPEAQHGDRRSGHLTETGTMSRPSQSTCDTSHGQKSAGVGGELLIWANGLKPENHHCSHTFTGVPAPSIWDKTSWSEATTRRPRGAKKILPFQLK